MSAFDERLQQVAQVASTATQLARSLEGSGVGEVLSGALSLLGGGNPLPHVRYTFSSSAEPGAPWHVRRVHTREGLSLQAQAVSLEAQASSLETPPPSRVQEA